MIIHLNPSSVGSAAIPAAVKQHHNAIYQKLDVSTRTEAITAALRRQLLKI